MTKIKKIISNRWDFTLYNVDGKNVLTVVFPSGRVDFSRSFALNEQESLDLGNLKDLAEKIRTNYENYLQVEVKPSITRESE